MKPYARIPALLFAVACLTQAGLAAAAPPPPLIGDCETEPIEAIPDDVLVEVETPLGTIVLETYSNVAPETVANFLAYITGDVDREDYDASLVHRTQAGFVIQMGGFRFRDQKYQKIETADPIVNEPCLSNIEGTIAMAKIGGDPNSATSQWFINLADNSGGGPDLDNQNGGFTVFGRVLDDGLDVANDIASLALTPPTDIVPPYYAGARFPEWELFKETPVRAAVVEPGGCFDPDNSAMLLMENPTSAGDLEPNEELDLLFTLVSCACDPDLCEPETPPACSRRALVVDPTDASFMADPNAEFGLAEQTISCDGLDASLASYGDRIADVSEQLEGLDSAGMPAETGFVLTSYTLVPEPGAGLLALAVLGTVAGLRRAAPRQR